MTRHQEASNTRSNEARRENEGKDERKRYLFLPSHCISIVSKLGLVENMARRKYAPKFGQNRTKIIRIYQKAGP